MKKFVLYTAAAVATGLCAVGFAPDAHAASGLRCAPPAGAGVVKNPLICVIDRAAVKSRKLNTNHPVPFGATR